MSDELAAMVLERMSQDSGPADCEPFTGWCVDLARQVLALRAVLTQHEAEIARLKTRGGIALSFIPGERVQAFHDRCAALEAR